MAVAGLVLGIIALIAGGPIGFLGVTAYGAVVLSIVGLILSCLARKKAKTGVATAGLVINIIALVLSAIFAITCGICTACATCGAGCAADAVDKVTSIITLL